MHTNAENIINSNCLKITNVINQLTVSEQKDLVLQSVRQMAAFFVNARKGFYCSLCDLTAHTFYDVNE